MDNRRTVVEMNPTETELVLNSAESVQSYVVAPIIAGGDPVGAVVIVAKDEGDKVGEIETKMAETAAGFLGKQLEQ